MNNLNFSTTNNTFNKELLKEALHTSRIEGSQETITSLLEVLRNTPQNKSEQMPYNMLMLHSKYKDGLPYLDLEILQDIFSIIIYNTNPNVTSNTNCIRNDTVYVCNSKGDVIYTAPPADKVTDLIGEFIQCYNSITEELNIYDVYTKIHWDFVKIHPFFDGNGRTARFLAHMAVLKAGGYQYKEISITTEIYRNLSYYYKALNRLSPTKFREFIEAIMKSVVARYDLKFGTQLSDTQRDFLNNKKFNNISISKYANKYNLPFETAINEITELEELGFVKDNGDNDYIKLKNIKITNKNSYYA